MRFMQWRRVWVRDDETIQKWKIAKFVCIREVEGHVPQCPIDGDAAGIIGFIGNDNLAYMRAE